MLTLPVVVALGGDERRRKCRSLLGVRDLGGEYLCLGLSDLLEKAEPMALRRGDG